MFLSKSWTIFPAFNPIRLAQSFAVNWSLSFLVISIPFYILGNLQKEFDNFYSSFATGIMQWSSTIMIHNFEVNFLFDGIFIEHFDHFNLSKVTGIMQWSSTIMASHCIKKSISFSLENSKSNLTTSSCPWRQAATIWQSPGLKRNCSMTLWLSILFCFFRGRHACYNLCVRLNSVTRYS